MKKKKNYNNVKFIISIVIVGLFVWFLIISPMISFYNNEKAMKNAAKRYFELYGNELPTGERVKTLSLSELYSKKLIDEDFYAPYSNNICSITNSWVKVKKNSNSNEYDYMVYLDCGVLQSSIDHNGPEIKINGKSTITVGVGDKYKDAGVSSVVDDNDGKLDVSDVTIKNNVDTSKIGTYEVTYTAYDSLKNKTTVTRVVKVVKKLKSVVKSDLGSSKNYVGNPENNYVRLSNMIFRIYGFDSNNNVILVAAEDVANVNFNKLNDWLNGYYYEHLNEKTKDYIIKSKYCNMSITDTTTDTTECSSYTDDVNVYIPSVVEVNKAQSGNDNFMKTSTISWVANSGKGSTGYVTRNVFYGDEYGKSFLAYSEKHNYGVRPMFTVSSDINIVDGDGTLDNPYSFGDSTKVRGGSSVTEATTGEYLSISGTLYRVIDVEGNYTKVIANDSVTTDGEVLRVAPDGVDNVISYNPNNKNTIGYFMNNRLSEYIDTSYFSSHKISVPVYKNKIIYGEEISTKTYKVKVFAPDMYEMFSAQTNLYGHVSHSYWLLNSSKAKRTIGAITDIGVPINEKIASFLNLGLRPCGYIKSSVVITNGSGTYEDPYIIK